jgi:hypothetical protein
VRSLVWAGDRLVDPAGGGASVGLDGTTTRRSVSWAYPFDRALVSQDGQVTVLYTALGTKGVVTRKPRSVARELNRSFYHADAYEYPIAVGRLPDERDVLIHCPDGYNRLAIETLADGERLASATERARDMFQSRLSLSPDGRHLLTAGWFWHPYGTAALYDVAAALQDGAALDDGGDRSFSAAIDAEVESACWLEADQIVVSSDPDEEPLDGERGEALRPGEIGVWSIGQRQWVARHEYPGHTGTLHAMGTHVLALHGHPRLLDPFTGRAVEEWPSLATGLQTSSIIWHQEPIPPVAVDAANRRFAVAGDHEVAVVELPDTVAGE